MMPQNVDNVWRLKTWSPGHLLWFGGVKCSTWKKKKTLSLGPREFKNGQSPSIFAAIDQGFKYSQIEVLRSANLEPWKQTVGIINMLPTILGDCHCSFVFVGWVYIVYTVDVSWWSLKDWNHIKYISSRSATIGHHGSWADFQDFHAANSGDYSESQPLKQG